MFTFWYYVAGTLYFLGVFREFMARLKTSAYIDYCDVFGFLEMLIIILTWPLWTAFDMVYRPIYWLVTHKWPACDICHYKSRVVIGHRSTNDCPRCYNQCVDADERVPVKTT